MIAAAGFMAPEASVCVGTAGVWEVGLVVEEGNTPYNEATIKVAQTADSAAKAPHCRKTTLRTSRDFAVPNTCFISLSFLCWEKSGLNKVGVQGAARKGFWGANCGRIVTTRAADAAGFGCTFSTTPRTVVPAEGETGADPISFSIRR
jgi:hypothetical protein